MSKSGTKPSNKDNKELDAMEADVKKALGKENDELISKTIAETKERLAREKELSDMKAKLDELETAKKEEAEKYAKDLESLKNSFKDETNKLVQEFKDARQSVVNNDNPFNNSSKENSTNEPSLMEKFKTDEAFAKEVDEESRKKFYEMLDESRY